jgi:hypothetical protein
VDWYEISNVAEVCTASSISTIITQVMAAVKFSETMANSYSLHGATTQKTAAFKEYLTYIFDGSGWM